MALFACLGNPAAWLSQGSDVMYAMAVHANRSLFVPGLARQGVGIICRRIEVLLVALRTELVDLEGYVSAGGSLQGGMRKTGYVRMALGAGIALTPVHGMIVRLRIDAQVKDFS